MKPDHSSSDTEHSVSSNLETEKSMQPQQETEFSLHAQEEKNHSKSSSGGKGIVKLIGVIILIFLIALILYGLWKAYQPRKVALQGRVEAETIYVSTKVPSRVDEVYVQEGQAIKKGQALIRFVSPEVEAKKQQAQAALQSALALQSTAERGSQEENVETLYANWQSVKAQAELAATTYRRGENLYKEGVISRQRRDEMFAAQHSAQALTEAAYQQYARAKRGSTPQQKSMADAQVEIARAALSEAQSLETETKLYAPVNGTISKIYPKPSELVAAAVPVVSILEDHDLWISLNVREDQYRSVYQQKKLEGYIPALDKKVDFKIKHIDAEGEFATIKTTRQTGGYDIRSFKLHLAPVQPITDLKVGMSVIFNVLEAK